MESHDTIVIGLGTAGLACLRQLYTNGVDVIGIDQKKTIGEPIRSTGGIASYFIDKLGMPTDKSVIASTISSVSLRTDDPDEHVELRFDHPVGYVYDFTKYEQYLARDLPIKMNERVLRIDGSVVVCENETYNVKNIVVATGPQSYLSPYKVPAPDLLVAYEETRKLPPRTDVDLVIWFSVFARGGYVWDFPSDDGRRIGLGYPTTGLEKNFAAPAVRLERFTELHPELAGEIDHKISHRIPVGMPMQTPMDRRYGITTYYVGEAAGTTFASTGGGLQGAFWTGKEAANAILSDASWMYLNTWKREIYPLLRRHYKIKTAMYKYGTDGLGRLFSTVQDFKIKSENATREIPRLIMYLMLHKPKEIPKLISALL